MWGIRNFQQIEEKDFLTAPDFGVNGNEAVLRERGDPSQKIADSPQPKYIDCGMSAVHCKPEEATPPASLLP